MVIVEGIILHKDGVIINLNVFGKSEILWFNDMGQYEYDAEVHHKIVTHVIPVVVVVINRARSLITMLGKASLFACFSDFCDPLLVGTF
jgi:hypothetical protein